jgi:MarR family transcriptional regulator, 2-MHQ and catechol-resistance regulon repressor
MTTKANAKELAELTFNLLEDCHQKEIELAKRYGLTTSEFHCLRLLNVGDAINNKDLAEKLKLSPGRLSRIVNGLVEKAYTTRKTVKSDRRSLHVSLSKKGEEMVKNLNQGYVKIHQEILDNIDQSIHKDLIAGMTQLLSALRKWMKK